jgi:hypothetical protein
MNCKQIREEIDTASRYNLGGGVRSHLNGCPDCRRYSDEAASLLDLLSAQPRVEVPTDFEFRLRARIARAQASTQNDRPGFLRKIFPETFSWGQMGAAAAALALVVTVSTFYNRRDDQASGSINPGNTDVANKVVDPKSARMDKPGGGEPEPGIQALAVEIAGATQAKFTSRNARVSPASQFGVQAGGQAEIPTSANSPNDVVGIDGSTRLYNPETKRLLNDRSTFYGAETASISLSRPAGAVLTF